MLSDLFFALLFFAWLPNVDWGYLPQIVRIVRS